MQNQTTILVFALTFALLLYFIRQILKALRETSDLTYELMHIFETNKNDADVKFHNIYNYVHSTHREIIYLKDEVIRYTNSSYLGIIIIDDNQELIYSTVEDPFSNSDFTHYIESVWKTDSKKQFEKYEHYTVIKQKVATRHRITANPCSNLTIIFTNTGDNIAKN